MAEDGLPYEVADLEMEEEILDIGELEAQMKQAASDLDFERAAQLRDKIKALKIQSE